MNGRYANADSTWTDRKLNGNVDGGITSDNRGYTRGIWDDDYRVYTVVFVIITSRMWITVVNIRNNHMWRRLT